MTIKVQTLRPVARPNLYRALIENPGYVLQTGIEFKAKHISSLLCSVYARFEADFCNPDLNLRLNTDGFLTGDMQMVLPPIRGIYLNPYTGYVRNNSIEYIFLL